MANGNGKTGNKVLYQDETKKALKNFPITLQHFHLDLAKDIALVKIACAEANKKAGVMEAHICAAIVKAAREVIGGAHCQDIVVDQIQGGAGTSMNMNINEIVATRATEILQGKTRVHYLDHVNKAQSTNDVVPTAMKITCLHLLDELISVYRRLIKASEKKAQEFKNIIKSGRTHLQDAVPMTLGAEFTAHAEAAKRDLRRLLRVKENFYEVNLGGTAVGTGITSTKKYRTLVVPMLAKLCGYQLKQAQNLISATQYADSFMELSAMLTVVAADLIKYMNDLRLLASGPRSGLAEISFEPRQKGSTIMPGKVNPVMAETVNQVCFQVIGNNQATFMAVQAGQLELNVFLPVVAKNLFESLELLTRALNQFVKYGLSTLSARDNRCRELFENSLTVATALTPKIGYDKAAALVRRAINNNKKLREVLLEEGILNEAEYDSLIEENA